MEFKSIERTVIEYLRKQIITGQLSAGTKLTENDLATQLDISRHPLREAFRVLESEHLVNTIPRKGTYVTNISIEDLEDLYQVREMIECYAIDLLKNKNVRDLPQAKLALEETSSLSLPSSYDPDEILRYHMIFANFHISLIESTGNHRLFEIYNVISSNLTRYQIIYLYIPGSGQRSMTNHREILEHIKAGAYEEAKDLMRDHIYYIFEFLRKTISLDNRKE